MKIIKIDDNGLRLIKQFEGFVGHPYLDVAYVPTIGYGFTYYPGGKRVTMQDLSMTESEASKILSQMVGSYEQAVDSYTRDDITQNQFNALVDFAYNCGVQALKTSTLLRKVNTNPNDRTIRNEFGKWVIAGGKKNNWQIHRRQTEANLYFS